MTYITITGVQYCFGSHEFKINQILYLEKDEENEYDGEAIIVLNDKGMQLGHVANSVRTVAKGTHSAGWIHRGLKGRTQAKVMFIVGDSVIAEVLEEKEDESYH